MHGSSDSPHVNVPTEGKGIRVDRGKWDVCHQEAEGVTSQEPCFCQGEGESSCLEERDRSLHWRAWRSGVVVVGSGRVTRKSCWGSGSAESSSEAGAHRFPLETVTACLPRGRSSGKAHAGLRVVLGQTGAPERHRDKGILAHRCEGQRVTLGKRRQWRREWACELEENVTLGWESAVGWSREGVSGGEKAEVLKGCGVGHSHGLSELRI